MALRFFLVLAMALPFSPSLAEALSATQGQSVLHLLDYVAVEYPEFVKDGKVLDEPEYAEQVEFSGQVAKAVKSFPAHPRKAALSGAANQLAALIAGKADGATVVTQARELRRGLIAAYDIRIAPARLPDLDTAPVLYTQHCAACHGANGDGNGPYATTLDPRPTDFHDIARQYERSVHGLYNTISLGVEGTSMPSFDSLGADERWALAFYVSRFVSTDAERELGAQALDNGNARARFPTLTEIVGTTPAEARDQGEAVYPLLAYLRAHPEAIAAQPAGSPIVVAGEHIDRSLALYREGRRDAAYQAAISAYLEGFELAEAGLDRIDHDLRLHIEQEMMEYRNLLSTGAAADTVARKALALSELLKAAAKRTADEGELSAAGAFSSAFIIILREGLEAILVLAAIAAFLIKSGRREGLKHVHAGWIAALLLGAGTWVVSSTLIGISGAQREVTEGVTALLSAAVLLYAGYWLHSRSYATRWQSFIRGQVGDALSGRTLFGLALVSFLAVYREVFETVLFMQALWVPAEPAVRSALLAGAAASVVVLAVLAWVISRYSARLPLGLFFGLSSLFLAGLAIMFAGQGVAALQAAGTLPVQTLPFPGIPPLGIYPNLQGLALQAVLVAIIVASFLHSRANAQRG